MKKQIIFKTKNVLKSVLLPLVIIISLSFTGFAYSKELVPVGKTVGITVEICGALVVGTESFESTEGKICSPASDGGLRLGDIIVRIDGCAVTSADSLGTLIKERGGDEIKVSVLRDGKEESIKLSSVKSKSDGKYKLGVWIKDSSSGIGTLTFYDPQTQEFVALGHGICDVGEQLTPISSGNITNATVASVKRGEAGEPGELIGIFSESDNSLGRVESNTNHGISGKLDMSVTKELGTNALPIAERSEVAEGPATILSNIEGEIVAEYSAEILKINKDTSSEKGMVIKITDERLLERTGGIVRGMSGSPIIQNGRIVGAVTHVFVNDPTRGYGIFIENMLSDADKIK